MKTDSDADKTIARAKAVTKIIGWILEDWSFAAIRGEQRKKVVHGIFDVLRKEKVRERRGKHRYSAKVSMNEARNRVLDALDVQNTFGADQILVVVQPKVYKGPGIGKEEVQAVWDQIRGGISDYFARCRFREAPASGQKNKMMKAAIELGTTPDASALHTFSDQFKAPIVVSVRGQVKWEIYKPGTPQHGAGQIGYFRCQGFSCQVYDRATDTIMARFVLRSEGTKTQEDDSNSESIYQRVVNKAGMSRGEAAEKYARTVGKYIGVNVSKRLFDRYYAMQPVPKATGGGGGPRDCPGCGDKILDNSLKACPACESPLPAATGGSSGGGGTGLRTPTMRDRYVLRFKGWDDSEQAEIMEALQENKEFANFKDTGAVGALHLYSFTYVGKTMITSALRDALQDEEYYDGSKVTKVGNKINIFKKP
jgi:hypothetical protein